jgi:hypothetical protein
VIRRCLRLALALGILVSSVAPSAAGDARLLRDPDVPEDLGDGPPRTASVEHGNSINILAAGAGLVAGVGLAVWLKGEANDSYDRYLVTADPGEADRHLQSAQRQDRASLLGWGVAQVSFVALVYFLTRESGRDLIPVEGEPIVRAQQSGLVLGFTFYP